MSRIRNIQPIDVGAHLAFLLGLLQEKNYPRVIERKTSTGKGILRPVILGLCIQKGAKYQDFLIGPCPIQGLRCSVDDTNIKLSVPIKSGSGTWLEYLAENFYDGTDNYHREGNKMVGTVPIKNMQSILEKMLGMPLCFGPSVCQQITANMIHRVASERSKKRAKVG